MATLIPITDTPRETERGFITESFARQVEREIINDPASWLWSHRRWKREVPGEVAELLEHEDYLPAAYSLDDTTE